MTNTNRGFSFVSHAGNKLGEEYLALSVRACTSHQNGLLSSRGRWDGKAVVGYRKKEEALYELLSGLILLTGGGPAARALSLGPAVSEHRDSRAGRIRVRSST